MNAGTPQNAVHPGGNPLKIGYLTVLLLLFAFSSAFAATSFTVSGYVIDAETGETMIGVNVVVAGEKKGTTTDGNGFFRIAGLAVGPRRLSISNIGYEKKEIEIHIDDRSLVLDDIPLQPRTIELEEVVVTGESSQMADISVEASHRQLAPKAIKSIPAGRDDVFRALKYLPGIEGVDPFSPLFSARGGDPGENLVLLDGVTIYNPYHFVTASGLFNLYAVKNIEMLIGGFGAEYGGRNSSVLYITTREGNNKTLHGELETTTTQTRAIFDFPVGRNATMMVSGRAFYNLVSRFLLNSPSYFYDANVSLSWKLNQKNRLSLRYFYSRDFLDFSFARTSSYFATTFDTDLFDDYDLIYRNRWSNQAITAVLKTILSPRIYLQTQLSGSFFSSTNRSILDFEYTHDDGETSKIFYRTDIKNRIRDLSGRSVLSVKLNAANLLKTGGEFSRFSFANRFLLNYTSHGTATRQPHLLAAFVEDRWTAGLLSLRPGVRLSKFSYQRRWYREPRINGVLALPHNLRLKAAWGKYYQYIISINSQEYELSQYLDNYYPLKFDEPSASTHYILGLEKSLSLRSHLSIDFYFKDISRVYTFDSGLNQEKAVQFSDELRRGAGEARGVEILWKGTWKRFSGWVSYGLSRARRQYPHILDGRTFLFDYDRTHSFKAVIDHQIHPALAYNGTLQIMSGVPKTLEKSIKSYYHYDPKTGDLAVQAAFVTDRKNNARLPFYVRLDLGLKKRIRRGFGAELAAFLGAEESHLNVRFGNLLFLRRNVWLYMPVGGEKYYAIGSNYFPEFGMGYTISF